MQQPNTWAAAVFSMYRRRAEAPSLSGAKQTSSVSQSSGAARPAYSPDLMAVEPLWRWRREDVTYHHRPATADDLIGRVAAFEADVNADPCGVAGRLWVKDHLEPEEEKLRFSK